MANLDSPSMTDLCEQVNPRVLLEMRRTRPFPDTLRVQESWVAEAEKRALLWLGALALALSAAGLAGLRRRDIG